MRDLNRFGEAQTNKQQQVVELNLKVSCATRNSIPRAALDRVQFQVCTLGVKPPLLFTHVYECKVFASIVCKAACAVRVARRIEWDVRVAKGWVVVEIERYIDRERERGRPACAEEGVSTLGELPFRVSSKERRVEHPRILQSRPHKRMWKRRWLSFPSTRSFCKYIKREPPLSAPPSY